VAAVPKQQRWQAMETSPGTLATSNRAVVCNRARAFLVSMGLRPTH
jgi:hypothetical protein